MMKISNFRTSPDISSRIHIQMLLMIHFIQRFKFKSSILLCDKVLKLKKHLFFIDHIIYQHFTHTDCEMFNQRRNSQTLFSILFKKKTAKIDAKPCSKLKNR